MHNSSTFLKNGFAAVAAGALLFTAAATRLPGQAAPSWQDLKPVRPNESLRREVQHSIDTALAWLKKEQAPAGDGRAQGEMARGVGRQADELAEQRRLLAERERPLAGKDPVLATAYSVMALEFMYPKT